MLRRARPILNWPRRGAPREGLAGTIAGVVLLALAGWQSPARSQSAPLPPSATTRIAADRILPLEVTVNGSKSGTWLLLERAGTLYAPRDAFEEWRVQTQGDAPVVNYRGAEYLPLSAIPGFSAKVNFGNQAIDLTFSPQVFAATRLTTELTKKPVVSAVLPSFFANYDLSYSASSTSAAQTVKDLGMLGELGFSNGWGVVTSSFSGRNLLGTLDSSPQGLIRLETTFTRDIPASQQTLRLGDSSTRAGMWGRSVYFGGVQWGTNFAMTPGFITQPTPTLSGVSAAPSTVELYINDVLRQVSTVPTGPFAITNFPGLTGGGEARIVVRDLLGRETIVNQPFFTNSLLLARGLDDWSVEAGRLRLDLGSASNHYGEGFASGRWRRGFTDDLTVEASSDLTRRNRILGAGVVLGLPLQSLGKAAVVASQEQTLGRGHQWLLGLERQALRSSLYLQAQGTSLKFRQLGEATTLSPPKLQVAGNVTYATRQLGNFGLGFASVSRHDSARVSTISANYSIRIGERSNLTLTASRAVAGATGTSIGATLVMPLENNRIVTASATQRDGQRDFFVSASQGPGFDGAFAWRTLAGRQQGTHRAEGGLYFDGRYGRLSSDLSVSNSLKALRLGATGGLVLADGHLFATRRLTESFAVAEVAGYENVGIGLGSNVLTHTDRNGVALIPRLSAYQNNSIRIDPKELPISAEIDSIELVAVPAWRSAVKVVFPVRSGRGALVRLVFDDGEPAPAGAEVFIEGEKDSFYVARRGEAFVTGLQTRTPVLLKWKGQECRIEIVLPPASNDEIARVGPLTCKGVSR